MPSAEFESNPWGRNTPKKTDIAQDLAETCILPFLRQRKDQETLKFTAIRLGGKSGQLFQRVEPTSRLQERSKFINAFVSRSPRARKGPEPVEEGPGPTEMAAHWVSRGGEKRGENRDGLRETVIRQPSCTTPLRIFPELDIEHDERASCSLLYFNLKEAPSVNQTPHEFTLDRTCGTAAKYDDSVVFETSVELDAASGLRVAMGGVPLLSHVMESAVRYLSTWLQDHAGARLYSPWPLRVLGRDQLVPQNGSEDQREASLFKRILFNDFGRFLDQLVMSS